MNLQELMQQFLLGVFLVDFEFYPGKRREGNPPVVVCMVVRNLLTGEVHRYWQDELSAMKSAPFPVGHGALFVAYYASAEMNCFLALGWPQPVHVLDLFAEFRVLTNGLDLPFGKGLLGALMYFGIDSMAVTEKTAMRDLVLQGGGWSPSDRVDILDYCQSDVDQMQPLMLAMIEHIDLPQALLRGQYSIAVAGMETNGIPIDLVLRDRLVQQWEELKTKLVTAIDADYGVYESNSFRADWFESYLAKQGMSWPRLPSGALDLKDDTFKDMAHQYPGINLLRELRTSMSQMRLAGLTVGDDARNRCMLSMFSSKTARNQPSTSRFIFGPSVWMRGLIKPAEGFGIAYVDWEQQEFGIAAGLSGDVAMQEAYKSGDPYLAFAKQSGSVPMHATKQTHAAERELFKACVLAVQYGMGPESLSYRIGEPVARARQLLQLHRATYRKFWKWSDAAVNAALLGGRLWTTFGWKIHVDSTSNVRSLSNFPMQANGAEMLRLAIIRLVRDGVRVCAPVHDAILIEAPLETLDEVVQHTMNVMRRASSAVLGGFELASDAKVIRYPDRYSDPRGEPMWERVMSLMVP